MWTPVLQNLQAGLDHLMDGKHLSLKLLIPLIPPLLPPPPPLLPPPLVLLLPSYFINQTLHRLMMILGVMPTGWRNMFCWLVLYQFWWDKLWRWLSICANIFWTQIHFKIFPLLFTCQIVCPTLWLFLDPPTPFPYSLIANLPHSLENLPYSLRHLLCSIGNLPISQGNLLYSLGNLYMISNLPHSLGNLPYSLGKLQNNPGNLQYNITTTYFFTADIVEGWNLACPK